MIAAALLLLPLFLGLDRWIANRMAGLDPAILEVFQVVTVFGRSPPYLVAAALVVLLSCLLARNADRPEAERLALRLRAERASFVFATVALAGIATNLLKVVIGRLRPSLLFQSDAYGFAPFSLDSTMRGFPSGHATTAFALAFAFVALWPRYAAIWLAAGCLVAASRFIVNAHYVGDVLGGALVAALAMLAVRRFFAARGLAFVVVGGRYVRCDPNAP